MAHRETTKPADQKRPKNRQRFTVARALLLGGLSFGSLVGSAAVSSADPGPIVGGFTANCEYNPKGKTAKPIIAATQGSGDDEQGALDDARGKVPGHPLSVNCYLLDQDAPNVASAFNDARDQGDTTATPWAAATTSATTTPATSPPVGS